MIHHYLNHYKSDRPRGPAPSPPSSRSRSNSPIAGLRRYLGSTQYLLILPPFSPMIAGEVPTRIGWDTYPRGPSHHTSPWHRKALNRSVCLRWGWRRRGLFSRAKRHTWAVRVTLGENYKRCGKPARFYPRKMIYKWWVRPHIYDSLQEGISSLRTPQKRVPKKCLGNVRWQFPCKKDFDVLLQLKYHGSQTCVSRSPYHGDSKKL